MYQKSLETIGYYEILELLKIHAVTENAKKTIDKMKPFLSETALYKSMRETSQAKKMLELTGNPPIPAMEGMEEYIKKAAAGELLIPEQLEQVGMFLNTVKRLKSYLKKGEEQQINIAFYQQNLYMPDDLRDEIERCIRDGRIDDYASAYLKDIRKRISFTQTKMSEKAEQLLKSNKAYTSDSFVVSRNNRLCIPIKKEYKAKINGTVVDKSSTGFTLFMEPIQVAEYREELELQLIEEDTEERRILYTLIQMISENEAALIEDIRVIIILDFIFARGKLSMEMNAIEPVLNMDRYIKLDKARHPMLEQNSCVPLNFEIGNGVRGVIITGPNTGGKTVAIKTVALLSAMACSGLHIPCEKANIALNSQILCDIGDGQNISDNLSTFSSHMKNVLSILQQINEESLIVMDELGSGTDPAEGMGIAIAILEQLRKSNALFLVTTHYPEVKDYGNRYEQISNARMAFDKESLKPLYELRMGESGESCALYIAKRLGIPNEMLAIAAKEAYGGKAEEIIQDLEINQKDNGIQKVKSPSIQKRVVNQTAVLKPALFTRGDSVTVLPDNSIGIVVKPEDKQGNVLVQIKKEKLLINHKRLKLKVAASQLYPEDYDFSIIFDTVEHRKARHQMERKYQEDIIIELS